MKIHPAANLFPMMGEQEFALLKESIKQNGGLLEYPVVDHEGRLVDGRNRHRACAELGIKYAPEELDQDVDVYEYVLKANLHRRQLKTSQRAMCAAKLPALENGRHAEAAPIGAAFSKEQAAALFGIGKRTVERGRYVLANGAAWLIALCESGKSVATAQAFIESCGSKSDQNEAVKGSSDKWQAVIEYLRPPTVDSETETDPTESLKESDVPAVERWLEDQDERPAVERFISLWGSCDETARAAIRAMIEDDAVPAREELQTQ